MNDNELSLMVSEVTESNIAVVDAQSRATAAEVLKLAKSREKAVKEHYEPMKKASYDAWKTVCAEENKYLEPLTAFQTTIKSKIGAFDMAERQRIAAEEQRRAEEAAALVAMATEAETDGDAAFAAEAIAEAMVTYTPEQSAPKTKGVSTRFIWRAKVIDVDKVPRMFMVINDAALQAYAKSTKGAIPVPGVEFYEEAQISARG